VSTGRGNSFWAEKLEHVDAENNRHIVLGMARDSSSDQLAVPKLESRLRVTRAASAVLSLFLLAACSGSSDPAPQSTPLTRTPRTTPAPLGAAHFGDVARSAEQSIVVVLGRGCGAATGTGFVVARSYVVTAAHVVAGRDEVLVGELHRQRWNPAITVLYDPRLDVSILRVERPLRGHPLTLAPKVVPPGTDTVGLGYHTNRLRRHTDVVKVETRLAGPDIYGDGSFVHEIYALDGRMKPGESGGPVLTSDERVAGMQFASARGHPIHYAVTSRSMLADVQTAIGATVPSSTGRCQRSQRLPWLHLH
jgi:S1-C subfamily serine protease